MYNFKYKGFYINIEYNSKNKRQEYKANFLFGTESVTKYDETLDGVKNKCIQYIDMTEPYKNIYK